MGNQSSSQSLIYLRTITDPFFGQIDIFRTNEIAYLMKKTFTFIQRNNQYLACLNNLKFMQETRHSSIVPVHKMEHREEKHVCIQYDIIEAYVEYYNFTLGKVLESGRKVYKDEIWYVLSELVDLAVLLKQNDIGFRFEVDNIFVSLNGVPCVYLFDTVSLFDELTQRDEEKNKQMLISLAEVVLRLASSSEDKNKQLQDLKKIDKHLYNLISKMLVCTISFQQTNDTIKQLISQQKITLAKTLSVTTKLMGQLKKQTTQTHSLTQSKQRIPLPPSATISLKLPPKFTAMQQTLNQIQLKKRTNTQKQLKMKRRMQQILMTETRRQSSSKQTKDNKQNNTIKITKNSNSLSTSTVTARQSFGVSQQIKPMRSSLLWRRKALELVKKQR